MKRSFNGLLEPVFVYFFFINRDEDGGWLAAGDGLTDTPIRLQQEKAVKSTSQKISYN